MSARLIVGFLGTLCLGWIGCLLLVPPIPPPPTAPCVKPCPPKRRHPFRPWRRPRPYRKVQAGGKPQLGGPTSPDGKYVLTCYLPPDLRAKNVGGRDGAGLCVFTSIMHSARWQNERHLWDFQTQMKRELGGGYPTKVDKMVHKYGPATRYIQYEGPDLSVLYLAIQTGRMPAVTYNGYDPHYRGGISHMVNLVGINQEWAVVLDNNFIKDNQFVWMSPGEFLKRWKGGRSGWAVVLLNPPPPPKPWN